MAIGVVIVLFDNVEVLDFAGPFEAFSVAGDANPDMPRPFAVTTAAVGPGREIRAVNGLRVVADAVLAEVAPPDVLLIPGGVGTRAVIKDAAALAQIARLAAGAGRHVLSVCTGSLVLGQLGLLAGLPATTHGSAFDRLAAYPGVKCMPGKRFVDTGRIVTSAGISAGIDMSLHMVAKLCGEPVALRTAQYMEYDSAGWRQGG